MIQVVDCPRGSLGLGATLGQVGQLDSSTVAHPPVNHRANSLLTFNGGNLSSRSASQPPAPPSASQADRPTSPTPSLTTLLPLPLPSPHPRLTPPPDHQPPRRFPVQPRSAVHPPLAPGQPREPPGRRPLWPGQAGGGGQDTAAGLAYRHVRGAFRCLITLREGRRRTGVEGENSGGKGAGRSPPSSRSASNTSRSLTTHYAVKRQKVSAPCSTSWRSWT